MRMPLNLQFWAACRASIFSMHFGGQEDGCPVRGHSNAASGRWMCMHSCSVRWNGLLHQVSREVCNGDNAQLVGQMSGPGDLNETKDVLRVQPDAGMFPQLGCQGCGHDLLAPEGIDWKAEAQVR